MMRFALLILLALVSMTARAADDQSDLPPALQTVEPADVVMAGMGDPQLDARVAALEAWAQQTADYLTRDQAGEDERILKVVQEELRKAKISVRQPSGQVAQRRITRVAGYSGVFELAPGETLVAIDGVPVNQSTYQGSQGVPINRYIAGGFEARAYQPMRASAPSRVFMRSCAGGQCR